MSGRGRGRGRGRAPPSGARLLLQRSAKEAGIESLQDITKNQHLFPDYEWHSSGRVGHTLPGKSPPQATPSCSSVTGNEGKPTGSALTAVAKPKRTASAIYLINKSREIQHRIQNSAFYVHPTQEADVVRYGKEKQQQQQRSDLLILKQMGKTADPRYIPRELLRDDDLGSIFGHDDDALKKRSLDDLAAEERADGRKRVTTGEKEDDGNLSDAMHDPMDDEEEEDVDYATNYYASEDEASTGGGGIGGGDEAVF